MGPSAMHRQFAPFAELCISQMLSTMGNRSSGSQRIPVWSATTALATCPRKWSSTETHRCGCDGWEGTDDLLDLRGIQRVPSAENDIFQPVDQVKIASLVAMYGSPVRSQPSRVIVVSVADGFFR